MPLVMQWTGVETRALRVASRFTLEEFAQRLGVSDRAVSKWEEAGLDAVPRMASQAMLDTMLAQADVDVRGRFVGLLDAHVAATQPLVEPDLEPVAMGDYHRHPRDGKLMTLVPAGLFLGGEGAEPLWVEEYYIDVFPTTNADWARFVADTGHAAPEHWEGGRCPRALYDHPVVEVTWKEATAYAEWAGKALPTAEQWEKAARGTAGAVYPWGDRPAAAKCNVKETGVQRTTSVSRYHSGVSPFGVYDMVGNVWEWLATPTTPGRYEVKGASFHTPLFRGQPSAYNDADDFMRDDDTGFRCVAAAETFDVGS